MKKQLLFLFTFCVSQFVYGQYLVPTLDKTTNKYGYKEKDKIEWSLEPIYKNAHSFWGNLAIVNDGEYEFVIDNHGKKVSPNFKSITWSYSSKDEMLPYICQDLNGNYNIYDTQFNPICKTSYQFMSYMPGYSVISFKSEGMYGVMDLEGKTLVPPIYKNLELENNYYICGYKRCDKDGIKKEMFDEVLITAKDINDKYGIITLDNEIIVPFKYTGTYKVSYKGAKGAYKKTIKPYLLSSKRKELDLRIKEAKMRISAKNIELAKIYPTDLPTVEKTIVKKIKKGYAFFKANKQVSKTYQSIDYYDKCSIVSLNGKYGITDPLGTEITSCEYDNISIWNTGLGDDVLLAKKEDKYNLIKADGTKLAAKDCDMIFLPSNETGVAIKDGQYWLIDKSGNIVSEHGYENIDNYSTDQKIYAELLGYKTELSTYGKEATPIIKQIFDEAYNKSIDYAQEKYDKYMLCISLDPKNKEGYRALSLNNIGAMFEDLGNVDKAMEYYEQARNLGNETARKNIKRIKLDRTLNTLEQIGNALSQVAQTIDTSGTYTTVQQGDGNYQTTNNSNYETTTEKKSNKRSYEFWKQQYDRWERNAKSCYDSLTNNGYKTKKDGQDSGGSAAGSWGVVTFSGMKMNLRQAQREMRDIRTKARKDGYNIPQSNYETINVSY